MVFIHLKEGAVFTAGLPELKQGGGIKIGKAENHTGDDGKRRMEKRTDLIVGFDEAAAEACPKFVAKACWDLSCWFGPHHVRLPSVCQADDQRSVWSSGRSSSPTRCRRVNRGRKIPEAGVSISFYDLSVV